MTEELFDTDRIDAIASRLDLRRPNREALESIVFEVGQHYDIDGRTHPFEAVVDVATGVGKTYIMAGAIEYFAGEGIGDFAVIAPGKTILEKTVANFTPGHPKSVLGGMEVRPVVITSDNFASAAMRAAMEDLAQVKVYIFTVQALLKPQTTIIGRRTHKFQEGLGSAFYEHLQGIQRLVVFADEHHTYYGKAFSGAVRDLDPWALVGLTATPHKQTPQQQIIYAYPLAAAIAEKLVKTPVLVGRRDDRSDVETKLLDGVRLLELKEQALAGWKGDQIVNPVMLVVAPTIDEANEIATIAQSEAVRGGAYDGKVLTVHSSAPDEALRLLDQLEQPDSPYRIVVSVGMLKEGWDVKNVYVIASMRASVSELLTEQTLGRGMRLPFGQYTGVELLDTLEVLGHERYEQLLNKAGVLNQQFIDRRTRAVLRQNAEGQIVVRRETTETQRPVVAAGEEAAETSESAVIRSVDEQASIAAEQVAALQVELAPGRTLTVPLLKMTPVRSQFSLADITDRTSFRKLGEKLRADPGSELRRTVITAQLIEGPDGLPRTEIIRTEAADRVESPPSLRPLDDLRRQLEERVLAAPVVPARRNQRAALQPILDEFMGGLGPAAQELLTSYLDRAAARLIQLVTEQARAYAAKPSYEEVVEVFEFSQIRHGRAETSSDRLGPFKRGRGYEGYTKSLYAQDWFDSSTERAVANILDEAKEVEVWVRLGRGDLPILWKSEGREYNPDFIVVERDGLHTVLEVKMDKEVESADVKAKREHALRWANHVSSEPAVGAKWTYLLVSETDVSDARGSWAALRKLGS